MSTDDLRDLSDEDLVARFRELKSEGSGGDPSLTPPDHGEGDRVSQELERRGLAPDREDVIPDDESPEEDPVVEDRA